jgi:hypothetical protein
MSGAGSAARSSTRATGDRGIALRILGVVAPLGLMMVLAGAPSASAAPKTVQGFVGGPLGPAAGAFTQPRDVAVYEGMDADPATDKWFVVEAQSNNMRVQRLDGAGNFELMWGRNVDASNPSTGYEVCTVEASCLAPASAGTGAAKGGFDNPMGVAVDQQSGWVYVYDRANRRIQKFDLDGNFVLALGKGVNVTTGGDVCTQASGDACGAGVNGTGAGQLATTSQQVRGIAIHPSSGDLFVSDPQSRRVLQYQSDGSFVRGWGFGVATGGPQFQACTTASTCQAGNAAGLANGQFSNNSPLGLAVDSHGVVYATDVASGTSAHRILRFDSDLAPADPQIDPNASGALHDPILPTGAGGPLLATTTAPNDLEIDADSDGAGPDEETLLAVRDPNTPTDANTVIQELDIPTEAGELPADPVTVVDTHTFLPLPVSNNGFAVNGTTGQVTLTSSGPLSATPTPSAYFPACDCAPVDVSEYVGVYGLFLLAESSAMSAAVDPPSDPTSMSVQLNGTVDPGQFVRYQFQISRDGGSWSGVGPVRYAGGSQPVSVSQLATGLDPNTSYRVRLSLRRVTGIATAETLVSNEGLVLTDAVAPAAETLGSAQRTDTSVQLRGSIDPNGSATSYRFEYGPEGGSFGNHIPVPDASAGSANTASIVVQQLTGLVPNTAYHYRVVATNASGATAGAAVAFRTAPTAAGRPPLGARAYEMVSPADKVGGVGVGRWGGGSVGAATGAGSAARNSERFAVRGAFGSVLLDGEAAYGGDWAFSERRPDGRWASHSPVTHAPSNEQSYMILNMNGASDDLSTVVWGTNGSMLRPFPELAGWPSFQNEFVGDWDGRWEILAPTDLDQVHAYSGSLMKSLVSADGSSVVATMAPVSGKAGIGGLAGPGDPAHPDWAADAELVGGRLAYIDDVSAGLSDEFEGNGVYSNVGVCADGTELPRRIGSGTLEARACPAPLPGRGARLISSLGAAVHLTASVDEETSLDNAVSADGSRVFFLSPDPMVGSSVPTGVPVSGCTGTDDATVCAPQLFVRQRNGDGSVTTRWISRAQDGLFGTQEAGLTGPVRFAGASTDGDKVFFQTTSPLTVDDPNGTGAPVPVGGITTGTASTSSWDLYMYDLPDGPGADPADGTLTRISAGPTGASDCNVVTNASHVALRFAADDGSRAYFTCAAPLAGVDLSENGTITTPGGGPESTDATNLYAYDATGAAGSWKFVARLPAGTAAADCATRGTRAAGLMGPVDSGSSLGFSGSGAHCVRGTPDGAFVTFWTTGRVTLDDPDEVSLDGFAYDADVEELTRITAPQGGVGGSRPCGLSGAAAATPCHGDDGFGSFTALPSLGVATAPAVPGDRIAFFQTRSRLVAADVDDAYDVYQWRNGKLDLLSTGDSPGSPGPGGTGGAFYAGNDASGRNVYIATNDDLTWQDTDEVMDLYTARIGGGVAPPTEPVICGVMAGGCQGGGVAPVAAVPTPTVDAPGGGDANPGARATLAVGKVGAKARRHAARRGVLAVRVRSTVAGRVAIVARGRVAGKRRVLGKAKAQLGADRAQRVRLRLSKPARRALANGRLVRVRVEVRQSGTRPRSIAVALRRGARS